MSFIRFFIRFLAERLKLTRHKWALFIATLFIASWLWIAGIVPTAAAIADEGQAIFQQSCASCHTIDGSGAAFGPDLKGVTNKRDRDWLVRWISAPDQMLSENDPIASELLQKYNGIPMPNMGLQKSQVEAVVAYLAAQSGEQPAITAAQPQEELAIAPQKGDAQIGQKLFTGAIAFQNRAPACISCHSVSSVGALRGGTLGPDLTQVLQRYGETGLKSVLQTLPFPTMQGIYQNKLPTEEEQANLLAFFEQANKQESGVVEIKESGKLETSILSKIQNLLTPTWKFVLIGLGGFLVLALLSHLTWRDRFTGVRQRLVGGSKP